VFGYPRCLFLTSKDPRLFEYLRTRPKFVLQVYTSGGSSWIINTECTNHMTREERMFSSYEKNKDPQRAITFGDGNKGLVKGLGKIAISPDHSISNVFLVDSLVTMCFLFLNCVKRATTVYSLI
jgi:hypothetical protein